MMNVLIPTDFSENSKNAMRYAMDFFADCSVRFYMLHVSSPNSALQKRQQKALQSTLSSEKPTSIAEILEEEVKHYQLLVDQRSTRLNSSHVRISYAVFC